MGCVTFFDVKWICKSVESKSAVCLFSLLLGGQTSGKGNVNVFGWRYEQKWLGRTRNAVPRQSVPFRFQFCTLPFNRNKRQNRKNTFSAFL